MIHTETVRGFPPAPPESATTGDLEAARARECLDALWLALAKTVGTDVLDALLLVALAELEPGRDRSTSRWRDGALELHLAGVPSCPSLGEQLRLEEVGRG